jgi:hypothetical protein
VVVAVWTGLIALAVNLMALTRYCWYLAAKDAHSAAGKLWTFPDRMDVIGITVPAPVANADPDNVQRFVIISPSLDSDKLNARGLRDLVFVLCLVGIL